MLIEEKLANSGSAQMLTDLIDTRHSGYWTSQSGRPTSFLIVFPVVDVYIYLCSLSIFQKLYLAKHQGALQLLSASVSLMHLTWTCLLMERKLEVNSGNNYLPVSTFSVKWSVGLCTFLICLQVLWPRSCPSYWWLLVMLMTQKCSCLLFSGQACQLL